MLEFQVYQGKSQYRQLQQVWLILMLLSKIKFIIHRKITWWIRTFRIKTLNQCAQERSQICQQVYIKQTHLIKSSIISQCRSSCNSNLTQVLTAQLVSPNNLTKRVMAHTSKQRKISKLLRQEILKEIYCLIQIKTNKIEKIYWNIQAHKNLQRSNCFNSKTFCNQKD